MLSIEVMFFLLDGMNWNRSQVRVGDMTSIKISSDSKYALINYAPNVRCGTSRTRSTPDLKASFCLDCFPVGHREFTTCSTIYGPPARY